MSKVIVKDIVYGHFMSLSAKYMGFWANGLLTHLAVIIDKVKKVWFECIFYLTFLNGCVILYIKVKEF